MPHGRPGCDGLVGGGGSPATGSWAAEGARVLAWPRRTRGRRRGGSDGGAGRRGERTMGGIQRGEKAATGARHRRAGGCAPPCLVERRRVSQRKGNGRAKRPRPRTGVLNKGSFGIVRKPIKARMYFKGPALWAALLEWARLVRQSVFGSTRNYKPNQCSKSPATFIP